MTLKYTYKVRKFMVRIRTFRILKYSFREILITAHASNKTLFGFSAK